MFDDFLDPIFCDCANKRRTTGCDFALTAHSKFVVSGGSHPKPFRVCGLHLGKVTVFDKVSDSANDDVFGTVLPGLFVSKSFIPARSAVLLSSVLTDHSLRWAVQCM